MWAPIILSQALTWCLLLDKGVVKLSIRLAGAVSSAVVIIGLVIRDPVRTAAADAGRLSARKLQPASFSLWQGGSLFAWRRAALLSSLPLV